MKGAGMMTKVTCIASLVLTGVTAVLHAGTRTWTGGGIDALWSTPGNWDGGVVPVSASDLTVQFGGNSNLGSGETPLNQNIAAPLNLNRLEALAPGSDTVPVFLGGSPISFVTDGAVQPTFESFRENNVYVRNRVNLPAGTTLAIANKTWRMVVQGEIAGEGGFSFGSGAWGGELELTNPDNSYSGGTTYSVSGDPNIGWSRLRVSASHVFGTGPVRIGGGNRRVVDAGNTQAGGLTFHGTTVHANDFSLLADAPVFAGEGVPDGVLSDASVTLSGAFDLNAYTLYLRGQQNSTGFLSGVVSEGGATGLVKMDLGLWTLGDANSYVGATRLVGGVLSVGAVANGGSVSSIGASANAAENLVFDGGALRYTGPTASTDRKFSVEWSKSALIDVTEAATTLTLSSISGSGGLGGPTAIVKNGAGTLTLGNDGIPGGSPYMGSIAAFVINEGSLLTVGSDPVQLNLTRHAADGAALTLGDGATLGFNAPLNELAAYVEQVIRYNGTNRTASMVGITLSGPTTEWNTATFDVNDGAADVDLVVTSDFNTYPWGAVTRLHKTDAGTLRLAGTGSTYLGDTVIRDGRIVVGASVYSGVAGPLGQATSDLLLGEAETPAEGNPAFVFEGAGPFTFSRGITVNPQGACATVGCISDAVATFSGTLQLGNTVQLLSHASGNSAVTFEGTISGSGGVTKTGPGTVVLAAANSYTGRTTVAAGTLRLGASNRIDDASPLFLKGGTFDAAGHGETLGELNVEGDAVLDFGSGACELRFSASAGVAWTGTLTLRNWSGSAYGGGTDRLFVGTSSGGLTAAQLKQIVTPIGQPAMQLSTGEVVPVPEATLMMLK